LIPSAVALCWRYAKFRYMSLFLRFSSGQSSAPRHASASLLRWPVRPTVFPSATEPGPPSPVLIRESWACFV